MRISRLLSAGAALASVPLFAPGAVPPASADPCPDVEVVYARGTAEPPGLGTVGQDFVDALQTKLAPKTMEAYPVNYLASSDFGNTMQFAQTVIDGIRDSGARVQSVAATCPDTRIVLGGYSQGAVVAGFTTASEVPPGIPPDLVPTPMPPSIANHVAAVVLFGMPSAQWMQNYGAPPVAIGPLYTGKTALLCAPEDGICDGNPGGMPTMAHLMYGSDGLVEQAATFAAQKV